MLDERQHPIESLCDPSLRDSQGPAVLAYNDGVLSERDWEALRKIHSSSKKTDETYVNSAFLMNPSLISSKSNREERPWFSCFVPC